jgi:homoserine acetyltransferase
MKKIIEQVDNEGLESLLGKKVELWCLNYIYYGTLTGVNDTCVLLEDAYVVYETGELTASSHKDKQKLPGKWYVQTSAIESFGGVTK